MSLKPPQEEGRLDPVRSGRPFSVEWAAGIMEGEGWFGLLPRGKGQYGVIEVEMNDRDVVEDLHEAMFGLGKVYARHRDTPTWRWKVSRRAQVLTVLLLVRPYMGKRRTQQIDRIMSECYSVDAIADELDRHIKRRLLL